MYNEKIANSVHEIDRELKKQFWALHESLLTQEFKYTSDQYEIGVRIGKTAEALLALAKVREIG